jgi:hypothetical protein
MAQIFKIPQTFTLTISSTAIGLIDAIRAATGNSNFLVNSNNVSLLGTSNQPNSFEIQVASGNLRLCVDGNTPTTTTGRLVTAGQTIIQEGIDLTQVRLIRDGSTDAVITVFKIYRAN